MTETLISLINCSDKFLMIVGNVDMMIDANAAITLLEKRPEKIFRH